MKISLKRNHSGMTLVEIMVASGIGSIVCMVLGMLMIFSARSFVAIGNYADLDRMSRNALDAMSQDIRETASLASYSTNKLVFNTLSGGSQLIYEWNPNTLELVRTKNGATNVLLVACDTLKFGISKRNPITNSFTFYPATNGVGVVDVSVAKLVDVSWRCSRQIFGQKINTESVQTAKIVMRN